MGCSFDREFFERSRVPDDKYFVTKDSGERIGYSSGMQRDVNTGKPRFDLIIPKDVPYEDLMITRWANLMMRGAEKYGDRNWEQANSLEEYERFVESATRHFVQWLAGETDEDHAAAVFFNIQAAEILADRLRRDWA